MSNPRLGLLLFALGSSLAAACNAAVDPIYVAAGCPEGPLRGPDEFPAASPESVIDDFEDGDLFITKSDGRTGSWYPYPVASPTTTGVASANCVAHGKHSGHFIATGSDGGAGANWNASMIDPFTDVIPYNASAWNGFSFWIAAGDTESVGDMTVGINIPGVVSGGCMPCGDYHHTIVKLTRTWTRVSIRFEDLKQTGFGVPLISPLPKDRIVNFIFWPKNPFDFWIDDFRFEP
jgi:hypothetical protein